MPTETDVIVIGAGQSGLAATRALQARGIRPLVLEAGPEPAGSWPHYYDSLTLFSPACYSSLPGLAFPGDPGRYPHRDEVAAYLRGYADRLGADIRTDTRATAVEAHDQMGFLVHTATGQTWHTAGVVAATGSFGHPYLPVLPGPDRFTGRVQHVASYRSPHQHAGERVVVVGAGSSTRVFAGQVSYLILVPRLGAIAGAESQTSAMAGPPPWLRRRRDRALRNPQGRDLARRNMSALADTPRGLGRAECSLGAEGAADVVAERHRWLLLLGDRRAMAQVTRSAGLHEDGGPFRAVPFHARDSRPGRFGSGRGRRASTSSATRRCACGWAIGGWLWPGSGIPLRRRWSGAIRWPRWSAGAGWRRAARRVRACGRAGRPGQLGRMDGTR